VRGTGSYWGAAGEQIDLMSGNLNFSLPIATAKSRGGWSANLMLSYNSQMWRKDGSVVWNVGKDIGYGLGWRLQAGSVYRVYFGGSLQAVIFTDATGAEYRMEFASYMWSRLVRVRLSGKVRSRAYEFATATGRSSR
jgi:hypothetical protein